MHTVLRKNSLNGSVLQQALHYCHIGMGSILLLQLSYCHTYKISPQNYKKDWEYTPKEQKYYNKVSAGHYLDVGRVLLSRGLNVREPWDEHC